MKTSDNYRILMFAPAFAPFANPESIVNSKLALSFLEAGWDVDIVTRNLSQESSYNYGSKWIAPWLPLKDRTHIVSYPSGSRLVRLVDTAASFFKMRHPVAGCRWADHAFRLAQKLHRKNKYDIVLSRALPDSGHLPALAFAKLHKLPWVANWNDATGKKNLPPYGKGISGRLGFFEKRLIHAVSRNADLLTFPSERLKVYISHYLPKQTVEKCVTIRHAALPDVIDLPVREGSFTICHAGHLSSHRNPRAFMDGLAHFIHGLSDSNDVRFRIIGIQDIDLLGIANELGIGQHIDFLGCLSYSDTLGYLKRADVNVIVEAGIAEGIYLPAKFVDYVQAGRPILSVMPSCGEVNDLLSLYGGGVSVDCSSAQQISSTLTSLYRQWRKGELHSNLGSECLYHLFAPETIIADYREIFSRLSESCNR